MRRQARCDSVLSRYVAANDEVRSESLTRHQSPARTECTSACRKDCYYGSVVQPVVHLFDCPSAKSHCWHTTLNNSLRTRLGRAGAGETPSPGPLLAEGRPSMFVALNYAASCCRLAFVATSVTAWITSVTSWSVIFGDSGRLSIRL